MQSSYSKDDVTILLKDITGKVKPLDTMEREKLNQNGAHYSEMLPLTAITPTVRPLKASITAVKKNLRVRLELWKLKTPICVPAVLLTLKLRGR